MSQLYPALAAILLCAPVIAYFEIQYHRRNRP